MSTVEIRFNGEAKQVSGSTVQHLLEELGLQGRRVAVELNREIVSRSAYSDTMLKNGDAVEIVHFVGGG